MNVRRGWMAAWLAATLAVPTALGAQVPAAPASAPSVAEEAAAAQAAAREAALTSVRSQKRAFDTEVRQAVAAGNAQALEAALARYRQAYTAEVLLEGAALEGEARVRYVYRASQEASDRYEALRRSARASLIDRLPGAGSDERERVFDSVEDVLHLRRAELEMAAEALRRVDPTYFDRDPDVSRTVNRTQARLRELLDRIGSTYVEEPLRPSYGISSGNLRGASEAERQAEHRLRVLEREADVAEYVRLARGGVFVDPGSGRVIEGTERQRIARNAEQQLVEVLRHADLDEGALAKLMGFADTRAGVAAEREADIKASDEYRALDFITPNIQGSQAREIFRALAVAVREEQTRINDWRAQRVPEGGEGGITGWLYEQFVAKREATLTQALEVSGWTKEEEGRSGALWELDQRIARFQRDADAVVDALSAAAGTESPADLLGMAEGRRHRRLLERYGFVVRGNDGVERYVFPTDSRVSARLSADVDLPGSSWMDGISAAKVTNLVVLALAPQLAAARAGAVLESLKLGTGAVRLGTVAVEALAGTVLDVGIQHYVEGQKIETDRLVLESLLVAPVIQGVSRVAGEASSALASLLKDRTRRAAAETFLTQSLGLASESALQTYWQAQLQGEVTYEDFLSNLVNGAISRAGRGAADVAHGARRNTVESIRGYRAAQLTLPEAARGIFVGPEGRAARAEVLDRAVENQRRFDEAVRTLHEIVGYGISRPEAGTRLVDALERGQYSWADLKMLYRADPDRIEPLMRAANEARARFSDSIVEKARVRAREQIDREYQERVQRLTEALKDTDQLKPALDQAAGWRDQQLDLLQQNPFAPGSRDLTSDIDRSVASPYFRNELKRLTDAAFTDGSARLPPTSARAYDLNEYIDVFPVIRRTRQIPDLGQQTVTGFGALNHHQAVEAASLSAAMLHMTPAQRERFKDNALRAAAPADRLRVEVQFDYAEQSLRRGEQELRAEIDRLVARGADRASADTIVRARDNLYGERTHALRDMEWQLSRMDPSSPEAKELAARIEREWSFALREGIETYSTFAGLDAIVSQAQLKDRSIRDLIRDPDVATAIGLSSEEARAMLNDQILMVVEHVHAFREGYESTLDAAAALGKYAERAVLALRLTGADLAAGPQGDLDRISELLVLARKNPAQLQLALARFGAGEVDLGVMKLSDADLQAAVARIDPAAVDRGLLQLNDLLQRALPGLDGVLDAKPSAATASGATDAPSAGPTIAQVRAQLALQRERERDRERERAYGGSATVAETIGEEIDRAEQELALLREAKARDDRLRGTYRREDWQRVERFENERDSLARQLELLPNHRTASGVADDLRKQLARVESDLTVLRRRGVDAQDELTEAEIRRDQRIVHLDTELQDLRGELASVREQAQREAQRAAARPVDEQTGSPIDVDFRQPTDLPTRPEVHVDNADAPELARAAALFGDLDRRAIYPEARPHAPAAAGTTLRSEPAEDARTNAAPTRRPVTGGAEESTPTGRVGGGGLVPATSVPPLSYELRPAGDETTRTSIDPDDDLYVVPGFFAPIEPSAWLVPGANDPAIAAAPPDPTTQRMLSVLDDLQPIPAFGGALPEPLPTSSGPSADPDGDVWLEPLSSAGGATQQADGPSVRMFVTSLGTSTGEAFQVHIVNDGDRPVRLTGGSVVLEPIAESAAAGLQRHVQELAGDRNVAMLRMTAYCLEFVRRPPSIGMMFRIAGQNLQQRFAPMRSVLDAAKKLQQAGLLKPDSDPAAYFHAIRQWAIWTKEQGFDLDAFGKAFVERTKQNLEELGQNWSQEIEQAILARVPGRWQDIQRVLAEAAEIQRRER